MLTGDAHTQFDADLIRTGHRVKAVAGQLINTRVRSTDPTYTLAFAIDLNQANRVVQNALVHSAEIARATRDLTIADDSPLRGPARYLNDRSRQLADTDIACVNPRDLHREQPVPIPGRLRGHIAAIFNQVAERSTTSLTHSAMLDATALRAASSQRAPASQARDVRFSRLENRVQPTAGAPWIG
jgi:hypothetical protein